MINLSEFRNYTILLYIYKFFCILKYILDLKIKFLAAIVTDCAVYFSENKMLFYIAKNKYVSIFIFMKTISVLNMLKIFRLKHA